MNPWIVFAIILLVALAILGFLYYKGSKLQKEQQEQKEQLFSAATPVTMLVIDKKRLPLKDSGLPAMVMEQTPKYLRRAKFPIVKAKVGPQIMSLICDASIFDTVPVKKEVKATISGIYITDVKGIRGSLNQPTGKKKGKFKAWVEKMQEKAGAKPLK